MVQGGALIYALRIPERFSPGKFDYILNRCAPPHGCCWHHLPHVGAAAASFPACLPQSSKFASQSPGMQPLFEVGAAAAVTSSSTWQLWRRRCCTTIRCSSSFSGVTRQPSPTPAPREKAALHEHCHFGSTTAAENGMCHPRIRYYREISGVRLDHVLHPASSHSIGGSGETRVMQ